LCVGEWRVLGRRGLSRVETIRRTADSVERRHNLCEELRSETFALLVVPERRAAKLGARVRV
jgi:hypothetical protein